MKQVNMKYLLAAFTLTLTPPFAGLSLAQGGWSGWSELSCLPPFTTVDFPGANFTELNAINSSGTVVGRYRPLDGRLTCIGVPESHGLVRDPDGTMWTLDFPTPPSVVPWVTLKGINAAGDIVGAYIDEHCRAHGFLYSNRDFTQIDVPGDMHTFSIGINSTGMITGAYCVHPCNVFEVAARNVHGFIWPQGATDPTLFDFPGARSTIVWHLNDRGVAVGLYRDDDAVNAMHGFKRDRDGTLTRIDVPGAGGTAATGINNNGDIVGHWCDPMVTTECTFAQTTKHAFKLRSTGCFRTFDLPGATLTKGWDIDDTGQIIGQFTDPPANQSHGYILEPGL